LVYSVITYGYHSNQETHTKFQQIRIGLCPKHTGMEIYQSYF